MAGVPELEAPDAPLVSIDDFAELFELAVQRATAFRKLDLTA